MAPLVILVGKNNTGKSYVASLIWALRAANEILPRLAIKKFTGLQWLAPTFAAVNKSGSGANIDNCTDKLQATINEFLSEHKKAFIADLFANQDINIGSLSIKLEEQKKISINIEPLTENESYMGRISYKNNRIELRSKTHNPDIHFSIWMITYIIIYLTKGSRNSKNIEDQIYIPAARTGLMVAYNALVSDLFRAMGPITTPQLKNKNEIPLPIVSFLQSLTTLKENTKLPLYEIAKEIEQKIMGGQISAEAAPNQRFMYSNKMCGFTLPLHLSSSMITELAPFILLLKAGKGKGGIVFEEPEAHLHLSAQRILARGIVRLVNVGVPVVITTHSDTFLQQINNMIHLHSHSNREQEMKRLGYNENEILDPDSVRGYEFIDDGGGTIVTELEKRREGLVVQSLNDPLFSLAQETLELQKDDVAETEKN